MPSMRSVVSRTVAEEAPNGVFMDESLGLPIMGGSSVCDAANDDRAFAPALTFQ